MCAFVYTLAIVIFCDHAWTFEAGTSSGLGVLWPEDNLKCNESYLYF